MILHTSRMLALHFLDQLFQFSHWFVFLQTVLFTLLFLHVLFDLKLLGAGLVFYDIRLWKLIQP